ncbi:hypothetical protein [Flavobacterium sp.]|jgi:hypothetical protein|uniref:hypothetical protein n=1 Tax=Flavobacterium sp. TaxID=239 RepID=UPI0037C08C78
MKKLALLFVLLFLMISCKQSEVPTDGNNFYFENPQPINDSELSSIPNKFKGIYMSEDSIFLNITNNMIFSEREYKFKFHKNQLDSLKEYFDVVDGKYISKDKKEIFNSKKVRDSIEFASKNIDTIFQLSDMQKAKRINGFLVLNQKDSIYWKVKLISLNKNTLAIKQLYSEDDLKRMDSITKIHSKKLDSLSYIISPSRKEFKSFNEIKDFGYDSKFIKVK